MESYSIFIVEDDPWYGEILEYHLSLNPEYSITRFTCGADCMKNLYRRPQLITVDYTLPDITGIQLLKSIRAADPDVPVIIISAQEDVGTAVELLKAGANDYLVKNDNTKDLLWNAVIKIRETQHLKKEVEQLRQELGHKYDLEKVMLGNAAAMKKVFALMERATRTTINVSVTGETGTGKELVAKTIHYNSDRAKKPFVAVNMAAIPADLLESELFGHEKGAFTGAIARKTGRFEEANKGTLFLDEIAELNLNLQSKLLRVLQERELTRVGGNEKVKLDIRLIVASHKNLAEEVKQGRFREDLFYRIIGLPIHLPPLRERDNDMLLLAKAFLEEACRVNRLPPLQLGSSAREKLMQYSFPGNVRELKAVIDLAAVMCDGREITAENITFTRVGGNNFLLSEAKTLKEYEKLIIEHYLRRNNNNIQKVADLLDIGKSTIYKLIQNKEINVHS
ncbi:MAG TPA: sigma-54 dependent transcriptional regulator [Chitinophaga sp.]|uniref:sigma-54-dependent transcriptional regulator n=1 Tax=Chitinophaga sp. TaxID=1869181 RepID=UPI002DBABBFC|nr:sigma-54 dependent transcriptional regulator [Chitinophaga sp.]HEU4551926.1 sigma-54 dependent transcriptional regulator [Chitinophaga sp.]